MNYVVWDWNGTLLDDVPLCIDVMSGMLRRRGLEGLTMERYREIFTFPVEKYYRAAGLDLDREPFGELAVEYITEYNRRALGCGLHRGAEKVLAQLRDRGYGQLIASASEQGALTEQVEHFGIRGYFQAVLGVGDILAVTKEGVAREYLEAHHIPKEDVLFIGDSAHDWQVAQGIGCGCVLIANGHESRARLEKTGAVVLDSIAEAPGVLDRASRSG